MIFFALLMNLTTLFAGNEHEHFSYLVPYENLQKGAQGQVGMMRSKLFFGSSAWHIRELYGLEAAQEFVYGMQKFKTFSEAEAQGFDDLLHQKTRGVKLHEVADGLAQAISKVNKTSVTGAEVLKSFFEVSPLHKNPANAYRLLGFLRSNFSLNETTLYMKGLEDYLNQRPLSEYIKTTLTVEPNMYRSQVLSRVKTLFEQKGASVEFFASIPRRRLVDPTFDYPKFYEQVKISVKEGWGHGIDITGSIDEGVNPTRFDKNFKQHIKELLGFSKEHKITLQSHMFEGSNRGDFYDGFWKAIDECAEQKCLPSELRIGHVNTISEKDLDHFSEITKKQKIRIIFDANPESNGVAQLEKNYQKMAKTIESIHRRGFEVIVGADGRGILGLSSSFEFEISQLKEAGLSEVSLERVIWDSYLPMEGKTIPKSQLLLWQRERVSFMQKILGNRGCGWRAFMLKRLFTPTSK